MHNDDTFDCKIDAYSFICMKLQRTHSHILMKKKMLTTIFKRFAIYGQTT